MNIAMFERAQVASYAYKKARHTGSLDCMKAICYVLRNRVKSGWGDGTWMSAIAAQKTMEGNDVVRVRWDLELSDRILQMLVRDIDDIYTGSSNDLTRGVVNDALYWQFIDLPAREWFVQNIARDPVNHSRIGQVGPLALFK